MEVISLVEDKDLAYVRFSDEEVDEIYNYVDLDRLDVEIWSGDNCLEIKVLSTFRDRLERLYHHNKTTFDLLNDLNQFFGE